MLLFAYSVCIFIIIQDHAWYIHNVSLFSAHLLLCICDLPRENAPTAKSRPPPPPFFSGFLAIFCRLSAVWRLPFFGGCLRFSPVAVFHCLHAVAVSYLPFQGSLRWFLKILTKIIFFQLCITYFPHNVNIS